MKNYLIKYSVIFFVFRSFCFFAQAPYSLNRLPYGYKDLEPYIDEQTMIIHHTKHHQGYIQNLNKAIQGTEAEKLPLEEILKNISKYPSVVRNNAGGHYNHDLFWTILTPDKNKVPSKRFMDAVKQHFGSIDSMKSLMSREGMSRFGSGWVWLSVDEKKKLFISSTPNQDNPLMDVADKRGTPILGIDVWEHAYYLKYQNKRGDYLSAIWNVINWEEVSRRYEMLVPKGKFDDWPEIKEFHKVMSQTFHPAEEGNLEPIKTRSKELWEKAEALNKKPIPAEFNKKEIKAAVKKLATDSKKLHEMIQKKVPDDKIKKSLSDLHDVFHTIVGLCSDNHEH